MMEWNKYEIDVAKEIVNIALSKAADSLSFFMKEKVLVSKLEIDIKPVDQLKYPIEEKEQEYHVLTTEIKGDIKGNCHLNFSEKDADIFFKASLPKSVLNNESQFQEMGKEMLMEVDNIITASVVTQFANIFDVDMHGYVPLYQKMHSSKVLDYMMSLSTNSINYLQFRVEFVSDKAGITPDFIWMLDTEFMAKVNSFVNKEGNILKLKEIQASK